MPPGIERRRKLVAFAGLLLLPLAWPFQHSSPLGWPFQHSSFNWSYPPDTSAPLDWQEYAMLIITACADKRRQVAPVSA